MKILLACKGTFNLKLKEPILNLHLMLFYAKLHFLLYNVAKDFPAVHLTL